MATFGVSAWTDTNSLIDILCRLLYRSCVVHLCSNIRHDLLQDQKDNGEMRRDAVDVARM